MMKQCCKDEISALHNHLADMAETLIKLAGNRESVMEEAAYRRAEMIVYVLSQIKEFVSKR